MVRVVRAARCAVHDQGGRILLYNFIVYIYIVNIPKLYTFILLVFSNFISSYLFILFYFMWCPYLVVLLLLFFLTLE